MRGYPRYPRTLRELTAALPRHATRPGTRWLEVEPAVYVRALLGVDSVPRDGKVTCPFHRDRRPSPRVYPTAAQGWWRFSCRRGGSIYGMQASSDRPDPSGNEPEGWSSARRHASPDVRANPSSVT